MDWENAIENAYERGTPSFYGTELILVDVSFTNGKPDAEAIEDEWNAKGDRNWYLVIPYCATLSVTHGFIPQYRVEVWRIPDPSDPDAVDVGY